MFGLRPHVGLVAHRCVGVNPLAALGVPLGFASVTPPPRCATAQGPRRWRAVLDDKFGAARCPSRTVGAGRKPESTARNSRSRPTRTASSEATGRALRETAGRLASRRRSGRGSQCRPALL